MEVARRRRTAATVGGAVTLASIAYLTLWATGSVELKVWEFVFLATSSAWGGWLLRSQRGPDSGGGGEIRVME